MGSYIATDELISRVGTAQMNKILVGVGQTPNSADATNYLEAIIGRAESLINSYVGKIYHTPLPPDDLNKEWALRFAEYEVYKKGGGDNVPVKYKESYNETIAQIKDCIKGELRPEGWPKRRRPGNSVVITSERPYFTARYQGHANGDIF